MPRIRSIHPDACDSEKLSMLSDSAERTFFRLLTHADDEGRGEDRCKLIAAKLYPLHDEKDAGTVDADLDELQEVGLLVRYRVDGRGFFDIPTFEDWQKPRHPSPSKYPDPSQADPEPTEPDDSSTADGGTVTAERGKPHAGVGVGVGVGVGGGVGEGGADAPDGDDRADPVAESFEEFWQAYPRHAKNGKPGGGGDRKPALRRWRNMSQRQRDQALQAVGNYRAWCESPDGEFPKHAATWLNAESWESWLDPPKLRAVNDDPLGLRQVPS